MTKRQMSFFKIAKNVSQLSDFPKIKIGAIVVHKHKIISSGYNSKNKCHRLQAQLNKKRFEDPSCGSIHAELAALLPLLHKRDLKGASIYTYREYSNGQLAISRPCKSCMSIIKKLGIKKIYYTTQDGYAEEILKY